MLIQDNVVQMSLLPGFFIILIVIIVVILLFARYWGHRKMSVRETMDDRWLSNN